jgi:hypothetical protein
MKDEELLRNFREIREGLENLNKMVFLIAKAFYDLEEDNEGEFEKNIENVQPRKYTRDSPSYLG